MDSIYQTVLVASIMSVMPAILAVLATFLVSLMFHVTLVSDTRKVAMLDNLLGRSGYCSIRQSKAGSPPGDGIHAISKMVLSRTTTSSGNGNKSTAYTIYSLSSPNALLNGNPNDILTRWVYAPAPWRTSITDMYQAAPIAPRAWQKKVIKDVFNAYTANNRASILMTGTPGSGKSRVAELIAVELKTKLSVEPIVIKNFDLTAKGCTIDDVIQFPTYNEPAIVVLDELDAFIKHAEARSDGAGEGSSIAKNRSSLLSCLDRLNLSEFVILIASSNQIDIRVEHPAYTRTGRFDIHAEI
jgi:hypothetical protein